MAGCGNRGCFIEKPKGQGTNGRCNCLRPLGKENEQAVKWKMVQLEFYKRLVDELERNKEAFPEPYQTMICSILENGKIRP